MESFVVHTKNIFAVQ